MKYTTKTVRLVAILSFCFFVLELSTTMAMPINEAKEEDRELRSALESFLQDSDNSNRTTSTKNGTNSSNNNSTKNRFLSDELVDDLDLDTSGSADDTNHENDEGDYFLKPKPNSSLPPPPLNENKTTPIKKPTNLTGSDSTPGLKSKGTSDSNRPVVSLSGPVDNTDLSLEQPDLPNHENKVVKEGYDKESQPLGLSDSNQSAADLKNDSSINSTKGEMENEGLDLLKGNNSDSSLLGKVEGNSTMLQKSSSEEMPSNASVSEGNNGTTTSKKKLLHFLDISENYTKSVSHNVTHPMKNDSATNSSSSNVQDKQLATMEGSSYPILSTPGHEKQGEDEETEKEPGTTNPPQITSPHVPQPIQYLPAVPPLPTNHPAQVNLAPVKSLRNPYENYQTVQNGMVMTPNGALNSKQVLYNRLYQNRQWQNRLQMYGRQSLLRPQGYQGYPGYQGYQRYPSYQGYQFLGQPSQGLYQRSRIEYPDTVLDSNGNRPKASQEFEDALFESGQKNVNDLLGRSTVKSLEPNSMMSNYGKNTRFYTNGQNSLLNGRQGEELLGEKQPQGNMNKKQAYNVYEAAIYLADLLKNESIKLDEMASGQHKNVDKDDDLFGGESDQGSGQRITLDQPESPVHSTLLSDRQVDKLIQAEDLGVSGVSDSDTSGKSPNNVPNFKSSANSLEEPEIFSPKDNSKNQKLNGDSNMENEAQIKVDKPEVPSNDALNQPVKIPPYQETKPAVQVNAASEDSAAALQPQVTTDTASVALAPQSQTSLDTSVQQQQVFNDDLAATQPVAPLNTDSTAATQSQSPIDTNVQQTQSFVADKTAQPETAMNTVSDQSQSFIQSATPVQPDVQPANSAYSAAALQTADASAPQQTFDDAAAFSTPQADNQGNTVSAYNTQQPAETTSNAAATQQWDTTAPQETQQYNDAAASSQQAAQTPAQTSTTNSYASEGKSHTIQLDEERYRTLICQNGKDTISCPPNKQISIRAANYGSMGASACLGRQSFTPSQICKTPGAYDIVKTNCDDMENCELMANDDIFGTECQTDKKYLDLEYDCVPSQSPSPYQAGYPQAMYPAQQPAASPFMYPGAQPATSQYQAGSPPEQQGYYGQQQQQLSPSPPPPKLPELMSRLVALSQQNQAGTQQMCSSQCNTCNQCTAAPVCNPCPVCQSTSCTAAPSVPYIPKGLRPLWELWNEKTADMNSMEMSALIINPVPKLPPTKKSSSLTEKSEGSGNENSDKRSHIKSTSKKSVAKQGKATKSDKTSKSSKRGSKGKHS